MFKLYTILSLGEYMYDIVIAGAGPAGCTAGILLSKNFNVLIIEKCKLPREKSCSGVLIRKSVELIEKYIGMIPESVMCSPFKTTGLTVITSHDSYDFLDQGVNIYRDKFDHWLALEAEKNGARILENTYIKEVEEGDNIKLTISSNGKESIIETKLLFGCDGINGSIRRLLGLKSQEKMITYQKFYTGEIDIDRGRFYAYTSPLFSQFDAWVNSKDEIIIVGVIANRLSLAKKFHETFLRELTKSKGFKISEEIREEAWALPVINDGNKIVINKGKVFLTGEAAGFLNPFGEGISGALTSSIALAKSCIDNKINIQDHNKISEKYKSLIKDEIEYMNRQWNYIKDLSEEFKNNDIINNKESV